MNDVTFRETETPQTIGENFEIALGILRAYCLLSPVQDKCLVDSLAVLRQMVASQSTLLEVAAKLVAWSEKYPSSRVYSYSAIQKIAAEIDAITEDAKAAIAKLTPEPCPECNGQGKLDGDVSYGDGVMAIERDCIHCSGTGLWSSDACEQMNAIADRLAAVAADSGQQSIRAERLMEQIMKTWDPPLLTGSERKADIAQTSTMLAIAYIMGREFMPRELTDNQRSAIDSGLALFKQVIG